MPDFAGIKASLAEFSVYSGQRRGGGVRLDANELRHQFPAEFRARLALELAGFDPRNYPDESDLDGLRHALAAREGVKVENVLPGVGSNGILEIICRTAGEPGSAVFAPTPAFSMYPQYARRGDKRFIPVPLGPDYAFDDRVVENLKKAGPSDIVLVGSHNNPTGGMFPRPALTRCIRIIPALHSCPKRLNAKTRWWSVRFPKSAWPPAGSAMRSDPPD